MSRNDVLLRIHPACEAFEDGHRTGSSPTIEEFLDGFHGDDRRVLFTHLLELDVDYRARRGETPTALDYLDRFPHFRDVIAGLSGLAGRPESAGGPDVIGDYEILREIGRGGMGIVYEATQRSLGRRVAVKVLPREISAHKEAVGRFLRESRAAARLHHTNIVPVYEVGQAGDVLYYSMQLIEGIPLDRLRQDLAAGVPGTESGPARLRSGDRPAWFREIARIGARIADALAYAHGRGILHRDVKPANLILDLGGTPWLTDFGLARTDDTELTVPGDLVGTLRYLAPERLKGHGDARADVYALGATLYELSTLRPLFEARDRAALLQQIAEVEPACPRDLDPSIPRDLDTIIRRAIAKEPADRYASASALAADLEAFLADLPIQARRTSLAEQTRRWVRRNRRLAAALAVIAVLLVGGIVAATLGAAELARQAEVTRQAARDERRQRYLSDMGNAGGILRADAGVSRIREFVEEWRPRPGEEDLRRWEWRFLEAYTRPSEVVVRAGPIQYAVGWTGDGKDLIGFAAGSVRRWDPGTGRQCAVMATTGSIWIQRGTPGPGDCVALCRADRTLGILDPEGREIAVLSDAPLAPGWTGFSPDGTLVASSGDDALHIWRIGDREKIARIPGIEGDFEWTRDGRRIIARTIRPWNLRVIDAASFETLREVPVGVHFISTHPSGRFAAYTCERLSDGVPCVRIVDVERGEVIRELLGPLERFDSIAYDATGHRLAAGGADGSIRIWSGDSPRPRVLRGHEQNVYGLAWHGDRLASAGTDGTLRVWDVDRPAAARESDLALDSQEQSRTRARRSEWMKPIRWLDGGEILAATAIHGKSRYFRVRTGEPIEIPDRSQVSDDGAWQARVERKKLVLKHRDGAAPLEFGQAPFHAFLTFGPASHPWALGTAEDMAVWLFDLRESGSAKRIFDRGLWWPFAVRPDGNAVAIASQGRVAVFSAPEGELLHSIEPGGKGILGLAWSPDGTQIALAMNGRGIPIWTPRTGDVRRLSGHASRTWSVAFHPDGSRLASGGGDRLVRIWDLDSGRDIFSLHHDDELGAVSWSPDGSILASLSEDGVLKLWDASAAPMGAAPAPASSDPVGPSGSAGPH